MSSSNEATTNPPCDPPGSGDAALSSAEIRRLELETEIKQPSWALVWIGISVVLHVTVVLLVIYNSPLRNLIFNSKQHEKTVTKSEMAETLREIVKFQTEAMRQQVERLEQQLDELTTIREARYDTYVRWAEYTDKDVTPLSELGDVGPFRPTDFSGFNLPQLYAVANDIETNCYGTFSQIYTVESAQTNMLTLSEARHTAWTSIEQPPHTEIDWTILNQPLADEADIRDAQVKILQQTLNEAEAEVAAKVAAVQQLLDRANGLVADDLVLGPMDPGAFGGGVTAHGGNLPEGPENPFMGWSAPDPNAYHHSWGTGIGPVVHKNHLLRREKSWLEGMDRPVAGRKLMGDGPKADWMFIDTWYLIGPFEHPGVGNLEKSFPPEWGIDLDAVYLGQKRPDTGQPSRLTWEWMKVHGLPIHPPRHRIMDEAVWYAWTEVYSDRKQTKMCFFGSDDFGQVWKVKEGEDNELIWKSPKTPHPWYPDRSGPVPVTFEKGYTQILFKLENRWGNTGFSMCIYLPE